MLCENGQLVAGALDNALEFLDELLVDRICARMEGFDAFCLPRVAAGETAGMFASQVAGNATKRARGAVIPKGARELGSSPRVRAPLPVSFGF